MRKIRLVLSGIVVLAALSVEALPSISLDGLWEFRFEEGKTLEDLALPVFKADDKIVVPGAWDTSNRSPNSTTTKR